MARSSVLLLAVGLLACSASTSEEPGSPSKGSAASGAEKENTALPEPVAATSVVGAFRPRDIQASGEGSWAELRLTIGSNGWAADQRLSDGRGGCAAGVYAAEGDGIVLLPHEGETTFLWNNTIQVTRVNVRLEGGLLRTEATTDSSAEPIRRDFVPGYACYDRVELRYTTCGAPEFCI
jgi:hypothetical protein